MWGRKLFTIEAYVKIKSSKFYIRKIIEEVDEKSANIKYDKIIKAEYGKPKSITKRSIRLFQEGDTEICNTELEMKKQEEVKEKKEEDKDVDEIELKSSMLEKKYLNLYRVIFNQKNTLKIKDVKYVLADKEDIIPSILAKGLKKQLKKEVSEDVVKKSIKSIQRMERQDIKNDFSCQRNMKEVSMEEMLSLFTEAVKRKKEEDKSAMNILEFFFAKGYDLFMAKVETPNGRNMFVELARNELEASILAQDEFRFKKIAEREFINCNNAKSVAGEVGIAKVDDKLLDGWNTPKIIKNKYIDIIRTICFEKDMLYYLVFEQKDKKGYEKFIESRFGEKVIKDITKEKMDEVIKKAGSVAEEEFTKMGVSREEFLDFVRNIPTKSKEVLDG